MIVLPSAGAELAPSVAMISEGILDLIKPQRHFQRAVQAAIARDPTIAQKYADLETTSPGILKRMGIGALADITPSADAVFARDNRDAILANRGATLEASTAQAKATTAAAPYTPRLAKAQTEVTEGTAESAIEGAKLGVEGQRIRNKLGDIEYESAQYKLPFEKMNVDMQMRILDQTNKMLKEGPDVTLQKFLNNEYSNEELMSIFSTPLGNALRDQLGLYETRLRINATQNEGRDAFARQLQMQAFRMWERAPQSTVAANYELLTKPDETMAKIQQIKSKAPSEWTPQESALLAAQRGMEMQQNEELQTRTVQANKSIRDELGRIANIKNKKVEERDYQSAANNMNAIFAARQASAGTPKVTVSYEEDPDPGIVGRIFGSSKKFVYRDEQGIVIPEEQAIEGAPVGQFKPPTEGDITEESAINQFKTADPAGRKAALEFWQREMPPEQFEAWKLKLDSSLKETSTTTKTDSTSTPTAVSNVTTPKTSTNSKKPKTPAAVTNGTVPPSKTAQPIDTGAITRMMKEIDESPIKLYKDVLSIFPDARQMALDSAAQREARNKRIELEIKARFPITYQNMKAHGWDSTQVMNMLRERIK